jgi:hypothetical protein
MKKFLTMVTLFAVLFSAVQVTPTTHIYEIEDAYDAEGCPNCMPRRVSKLQMPEAF